MIVKHFKKKELLFNEGGLPNYLYFVTKGKIKTFKEHEYGKELVTHLYKEGEFLGYVALLENSIFTESAEAMEDSEICLIPKEDFFSLLYNNGSVMKKFVKMLSADILEKEEQLINLAYSSVRKRVANALVTLYEKFSQNKEEKFSMSISREDLANIVGTATESLIRTLSDFKEEKLVEIKGSNISVVDIEKLRRLKA